MRTAILKNMLLNSLYVSIFSWGVLFKAEL